MYLSPEEHPESERSWAEWLSKIAGIITSNKTFDFFFGKVFGIYHAMDNFTGRKEVNK